MDGNIKDTPPIIVVPQCERSAALGRVAKEIGGCSEQDRGPQAGSPAGVRQVAGRRERSRRASAIRFPAMDLRLHAPLERRRGQDGSRRSVDGKPRSVEAARPASTGRPGKSRRRRLPIKPGDEPRVADAGDFEKDQAFSVGAWVKLPHDGTAGALVAAWTTATAYRGWDLWIEERPRRHAHHQQVAGRRPQGDCRRRSCSRTSGTTCS